MAHGHYCTKPAIGVEKSVPGAKVTGVLTGYLHSKKKLTAIAGGSDDSAPDLFRTVVGT